MMETISYLDYDEVLSIYQKMIDKSGGGFAGTRDEGAFNQFWSLFKTMIITRHL